MQTILLATGNEKKGKELQELCAGRFVVKTLKDLGLHGDPAADVVEDAPDFLGNAWKKCHGIAALVAARGLAAGIDIVIADDSGLCVDALDGHPGVRSARFAKDCGYGPTDGDGHALDKDAANNRLLLTMLAPIPAERRGAHFACFVVARNIKTGAEVAAEGDVAGFIAKDLYRDDKGGAGGGFGYDPLFIVAEGESAGLRMAQLASEQKHAISHRARAFTALAAALQER